MTAPVKTKNKVGRPSSYRPEYCEALIKHMASGLSYECFGAVIDVAARTIYGWEEVYPEFMQAKKLAFDKCRLWWEQAGQQGLWSDKERSLNTGVWIFNMKNRFNWTDKRELNANIDATVHRSKEKQEFIEHARKQYEAEANERKQS